MLDEECSVGSVLVKYATAFYWAFGTWPRVGAVLAQYWRSTGAVLV